MKNFFKTFFAALLAFVAGSGCLVVLLFFGVTGFVASIATLGSDKPTPTLRENTILKVQLSDISEIVQEDPLATLSGKKQIDRPVSLTTAIRAIAKAKNNPNISAIYLSSESISAGMASIDELRRALDDFASSGKPILAYGDSYTQKGYYLSSIADYVVLNPQGNIGLIGIASGNLMLKGALDRLGVKMEVFKVGTYKSAVEPYMLTAMSDANKLQTQEYIDGLWTNTLKGISESRGIEVDSLRAFADRGAAFAPAGTFVEAGLVDTLAYRSEVPALFAKMMELKDEKELRMIGLADMDAQPDLQASYSSDQIRVIYAEGEITDAEPSPYQPMTTIGYSLVDELKEAMNASEVKAVVLRVNSPGGSAFLSEQIWYQMKELRKKKPVVVSMGDYAASGGYYISAPANMIVAEPNTLTGSIGIFGLIPNVSKAAGDFGLNLDIVKTSKYADLDMGIWLRPLTDDQRMLIQREIERGYDIFLSRVSDGRRMTKAQVDSIGQGRVWLGTRALELGLVDKLGGVKTAIEEAAKLAKLSKYEVNYGTTSKNLLMELLQGTVSSDKFVARLKGALLSDEERRLMRLVDANTRYAGIQARLPYEFAVY